MSLDVNSVEIESLTVNGVEAETAYVNGVEVFKSSQGIYAENHGGYLISLDKGLVETSTIPTLGSGASTFNYAKSYAFTDSFYFVSVRVGGVDYIEKIDAVTGNNLGRSPAFTQTPAIITYNSKDGYIYAASASYVSKILASDMSTSIMNQVLSIFNPERSFRLSKDGDYLYYISDTIRENMYRLRCSDLVTDAAFYDGNASGFNDVRTISTSSDDHIYVIDTDSFLYKINASTMNRVNLPDGSTRHGVFLSGQGVQSVSVDGDFVYIGYTNGRLRKVKLSDGAIISTVTTALDGQSGDSVLHVVVDGAYVYCACQGSGESSSKLIDVRNSSDLSLFNTVNLSTTYGNWGVRSLSFRESPYDYLN